MNKEYFSHDIDSSNDPELSAMIGEFKDRGYGIYWRTVEMLHKEGGFLPMNTVTYLAISRSIESDLPTVKNVIEKSISDYKLFFVKKEKFSSKRVLKNLQKRMTEKSAKSKAGKASAKKRYGLTRVEQPLTDVEQNLTKESKGKESKGKNKENAIFINPFSEQFMEVWNKWKIYKEKQHKFKYRSVDTEQAAMEDLVKLSDGDEIKATMIVQQSIAKGWKGFFELKDQTLFSGRTQEMVH